MPRAMAVWHMDLRRAEPPMSTFQRLRSSSLKLGWFMSMCMTVGTQWEKVTPSPATSWRMVPGAYLPG